MSKKISTVTLNRMEDGISGNHPAPVRLPYAEEALRTMSLPGGENYITWLNYKRIMSYFWLFVAHSS
jgi:hypothetical protein